MRAADAFKKAVVWSADRISSATPSIGSDVPAGTYEGVDGGANYVVSYPAGSASKDNGVSSDVYIINITNIGAVMAGAQPVVAELGPFAYRTYEQVDMSCGTCGISSSAGTMTWINAKIVRRDPVNTAPAFASAAAGGAWDSYITVPNPNWHGLTALLHSLNPLINNLEDLIIPFFFLKGFGGFVGGLPVAIRSATLPLTMFVAFSTVISGPACLNQGAGAPLCAMTNWRSNAIAASSPATAAFGLGSDLTNTIPVAALTVLFNSTADAPYSLLSTAGWSGLLGTASAAAAGSATAVPMWTAGFVAAVQVTDPAAYTGSNAANIAPTVAALLTWTGKLMSTATNSTTGSLTDPVAASAFEFLRLGLNANGLSAGGVPISSYSDFVFAQLGSNSIGSLIAGGPGDIGTAVTNVCSAGESLADVPQIAAQLPGGKVPEFSCWNARSNANSFGTKLTPSQMLTWWSALSNGPALVFGPLPVAGSNGFMNTAGFLGGAAAMQARLTTAMANFTASKMAGGSDADALTAAATAAPEMQDTVNVLLAYKVFQATPAALAVAKAAAASAYANAAAAAASCPAPYNPLGLPLKCFQILDLASFANYVAKDVIFASFASVGPRISTSGGSMVPHTDPYFAALANEPSPLRAGPFLKCTVREYLEKGCHDNLQDFALATLGQGALGASGSPGFRTPAAGTATSYEGSTRVQALQALISKMPPQTNGRFTGASSTSNIGVITLDSGKAGPFSEFGGPLGDTTTSTNPLAGSYDGNLFTGTYDPSFWSKSPSAPASQTVWVYQARRALTLPYTSEVTDPSGAVKLYRYSLPNTLPKMKTDDPTTPASQAYYGRADVFPTPTCAVNIAPLSSGVVILLAPPYFQLCYASGMPGGTPVPGYAYTAPSLPNANAVGANVAGNVQRDLNTYIDVEPITGATMNGFKRLGAHIAWQASPWFPMRKTYGLMYWVNLHATVDSSTASTFADAIATLDKVMKNLTAGLVAVGVILIVLGLVCVYFGMQLKPAFASNGIPSPIVATATADEFSGPAAGGDFSGSNPLNTAKPRRSAQQADSLDVV